MVENEPVSQSMPVVEREVVSERPFSLSRFGDALRRHKRTALLTFAGVLLLGLLMLLRARPLYQASVRMLVETRAPVTAVNDSANAFGNLFAPTADHAVETQVQVLQSSDLQNKVAQRLDINPESVKVVVRQVGKTDLAELLVTSNSRANAEKFAATLPTVYLENARSGRLGEITTALSFARRRLREKTGQLERAEQNLRNFKSAAGVVNPEAERTEDITASAAAAATARTASAEAAGASARLRSLQGARSRLSAYTQTPVTTTNPEVAVLQDRIAAQREERARLLFLYKPNHDEVRKVDVNVAALQRRLGSTPRVTTIVTRAPNPAVADLDAKIADTWAQYRAAQANYAAAAASARRLQGSLARYNSIEMRQAQLQRAIDQRRSDVEVLSRSVEEMSLRQKAAEAANAPLKVDSISGAKKVAPSVFRHLLVTTLLGLLLGCAAALMRDSTDNHIQDEDEARSLLGMPVLGYMPAISGSGLLSPNSDPQLLESYRMLRSNVQFSLPGDKPRALLLTSTTFGEGKTGVAANLAIINAMANRRVVLIDADLRDARLHEIFHLRRAPGLAEVLAGQLAIEDALQSTDTPNLRVLACGAQLLHETEFLNSAMMDETLEKLKASADFIIFNGPPFLSSSDAQVLSAKADGVLYALELGRVERSEAQRSLELLERANANVLGLVINKAGSAGERIYNNAGIFNAGARARNDDSDPFARRVFNASGQASNRSSLWKKIALGAGALLLALLLWRAFRPGNNAPSLNANSGGPAAAPLKVQDIIGRAQVWKAGQWKPLRKGESLAAASSLRTSSGAALLLKLGQSGMLRVGETTQLKANSSAAREYSLLVRQGKVWARFDPGAAEMRLKVRTPAALATSEGGTFSIASGLGGALTTVSTDEGSVAVRRGSETTEVSQGDALRVNRGGRAPLIGNSQQDAARRMWQTLRENESWLNAGGAMKLDRATIAQLTPSLQKPQVNLKILRASNVGCPKQLPQIPRVSSKGKQTHVSKFIQKQFCALFSLAGLVPDFRWGSESTNRRLSPGRG